MKKVVIVGVGALGSHVAQFLRNEAELKVIDFDRVETKNVLSQFHIKPSIGKNKAASLKGMFAFLYGIKIEAVEHRLTTDNVQALIHGSDLTVVCVDNIETRLVIKEFLYLVNEYIPCLHGAVDAAGSFGQVVWDQDFKPDEETAGAATCEGGEHLPFITVVAAVIARTAQQYLKTGQQRSFSVLPDGRAIQTT